ncbi:MAG: polyamine aminopropyltransferase [Candidatus Eisenbacteria bacterium]|uniref:Polyamine aminopropyltransferase n=1 Tax=Eiseniibacteriota bacterium TaxID=2212470 RepID=A0A948W7T7_UNCEI|nr:polyamine aminopropyltransferase [Candidatus Eisenbacteria bacterium]MBU1950181.1 polyamine aminopropyltransferase [Candidatus Eisenbacteria bacterium]MBU2692605.1 polyamine aminopropyltransferase [Candidatus Eisenbacteria bacterium]
MADKKSIAMNMTRYITETVSDSEFITYVTEKILYNGQSDYQQIQVFETKAFGRILMLDQAVQFTDVDEFIYHEMLTHMPMLVHPKPERILIVGGGDGGAAREALRHPEVKNLELCEIDEKVCEISRKYFPQIATSFDDPRFKLNIGDGIARLKGLREGAVDVIIIDGTDPTPMAIGLYSADFYRTIHRALGENGVFGTLAGSPYFHPEWTKLVYRELSKIFPKVAMYTATVPTYPGFLWAFCVASKGQDPRGLDRSKRLASMEDDLKYLNCGLFNAVFALPSFIRRMIEED